MSAQLLRPILAEIDSEGRLLRADEALARLNRRAGGVEGGMLAIPALARVAQLSIRLQMRLSRAIRVADDSEHLELWVEVVPEPNIAKLSIISWQVVPSVATGVPATDANSTNDAGAMQFDSATRLIRAGGIAAQGLAPADFGRDGRHVISALFEQNDECSQLVDALAARHDIAIRKLTRTFDLRSFAVTGQALTNGYQVLFDSMPASKVSDEVFADVAAPEAMFGKHLAPALRQPLGRIIANAETIGSELQGPIRENYALYARDIANAARHLSALVDDLGDLEAVERADFKTARDLIELGDVARRVAGLLALKAADHSIRILTPIDSLKITAIAEFRRTLQILLNLVNNAIRYSPDGTEVKVEVEQSDEAAMISVTDQGPGIAPDDRAKIFEKFERLGRSGDGGSGLGLYISRRLARAMGGDLSVDQAECGGAKFTLRLPNR